MERRSRAGLQSIRSDFEHAHARKKIKEPANAQTPLETVGPAARAYQEVAERGTPSTGPRDNQPTGQYMVGRAGTGVLEVVVDDHDGCRVDYPTPPEAPAQVTTAPGKILLPQ